MRRALLTFGFFALMLARTSMATMVPANVLTRVFQLRYKGGLATAFTIEVDGKQYLVTARHAVIGIAAKDVVELRRETDWQSVEVRPIPVAPPEVDIAVLAPAALVSPTLPIELGVKGLYVSQDVAFVGFPYGMLAGVTGVNEGYPIAFVKHGICSAFDFHEKAYMTVWIDAQNNEGFSGGPVIFTDLAKARYTVAAVVSAYRVAELPVLANGKDTGALVRANSGLMLTFAIDPAVKAIKANPIGAPLNAPPK
jgi:S1-C subfamily serine protease